VDIPKALLPYMNGVTRLLPGGKLEKG
jgi:hypothetical protein